MYIVFLNKNELITIMGRILGHPATFLRIHPSYKKKSNERRHAYEKDASE
jgi:hypothetical protein